MASGPITLVSDIVTPEIFTSYIQQITEEKSRLIQSGALARNPLLDALLAGGGLTFNIPSFKDLDNDADNISTDVAADAITGGSDDANPMKIGTGQEVAVRLSRNQHWSSADLAGDLAGPDPMNAIANRVGTYWARRLQAAFVATVTGMFADNAAAPSGSEHVQGDMTNDISGTYSAGTTDFSTEAFIDAVVTMGDSGDALSLLMVHSIVKAKMRKNDLIDFIPDSEGNMKIPTYQGLLVVEADAVPHSSGTYETWVFGVGAVQLGAGSPKVPTEVARHSLSGNGGGSEVLSNRHEWAIHPVGCKYAGTAANGGPSNAATSNNLAAAGSWERVYGERKQIKIARLITTEHA
jgi:hypothetical protein